MLQGEQSSNSWDGGVIIYYRDASNAVDDEERGATIIIRLILKETQLKVNHAKDQLRLTAINNPTIFKLFSQSMRPEWDVLCCHVCDVWWVEKSYNIQVIDAEKCDRRGGNTRKDASLSQQSVHDCDPARSALTYFLHSSSLSTVARHARAASTPVRSNRVYSKVTLGTAPCVSFPLFTPWMHQQNHRFNGADCLRRRDSARRPSSFALLTSPLTRPEVSLWLPDCEACTQHLALLCHR